MPDASDGIKRADEVIYQLLGRLADITAQATNFWEFVVVSHNDGNRAMSAGARFDNDVGRICGHRSLPPGFLEVEFENDDWSKRLARRSLKFLWT
jgi:hypothetical protein